MSAIHLIQDKIDNIKLNKERHKQAIADYQSLIDSSNAALIALEDIAANLRCNISLETYRPNWVKGLKIQAIKDYSQDSGLGLKDAKDDLEHYFRDVKVNHPNANNAPNLGDILRKASPGFDDYGLRKS